MDSAVYLITKADDIGSNDSANQAFIHAYEDGILKNGVIMMTCGKAAEAATYFKDQPGFCMGLHLTVNSEWDNVRWGPILPPEEVPSLVDKDGYFFKTTYQLQQNNPKLTELMAEVQAQYDTALALGLDIRFLDTHMGFTYAIDGADRAIEEFIEKNNLIDVRRFERFHYEVSEGRDRADALINALKKLQPGVYYFMMGHPAVNTQEMRDISLGGKLAPHIAVEREEDLKIAVDGRVIKFMEQANIIPVTMEQAASLQLTNN